jgi:hypothetical protein
MNLILNDALAWLLVFLFFVACGFQMGYSVAKKKYKEKK